jgi:hypothetical protein
MQVTVFMARFMTRLSGLVKWGMGQTNEVLAEPPPSVSFADISSTGGEIEEDATPALLIRKPHHLEGMREVAAYYSPHLRGRCRPGRQRGRLGRRR